MKKVIELVSVIIPNWNGLELMKICLPSLLKQSYENFEVIVVDNGSSDGSVNYLKVKFPQIKNVVLSKNFGFSKAVNEGIKASKGEFIFLLNNDTEVDKDCIRELVCAVEEHSEVGFVSAKILKFDRRGIIDNAGDYLDSVGHLLTRGLNEKDDKNFQVGEYIFLATGGGSLIKRQVFNKIGFFDESYFFYMEDADLCFRAQLAGFKGWFEPEAKIYHMRMASSKKNPVLFDTLVFRNMTITMLKDFPMGLILHNFNWLKIILVHLNTIRFLISKGYLLEVVKAEFFILSNLGNILKKRRKIQKSKTVTDEYIIENVLQKKWFRA